MKRRFTLIELLVVIAIISVLASMLLPALSKAREKARTIRCMGQQKNISTAIILYCNDNEDFYPHFMGAACALNDAASYMWNLALCRHKYLDSPKFYFCPGAVNMENYSMPNSLSSCGTVTNFNTNSNYKWQYTTYGYNFVWFGSSRGRKFHNDGTMYSGTSGSATAGDFPSVKMIEVRSPSNKIVLGDSASTDTRGYYAFGPRGTADNGLPKARHNNGCNYSFSDGHSETLSGSTFSQSNTSATAERNHYWDPFSEK